MGHRAEQAPGTLISFLARSLPCSKSPLRFAKNPWIWAVIAVVSASFLALIAWWVTTGLDLILGVGRPFAFDNYRMLGWVHYHHLKSMRSMKCCQRDGQ